MYKRYGKSYGAGGWMERVSMDIDIIDGKLYLNGQIDSGLEGFEIRTKGIRKSESGLWVCDKCGSDGAKRTYHRKGKDGGHAYYFKCDCGNRIKIEKRRVNGQ